MQSSCSEVAPICCCACTCKISSKNFSLSPYKICIVTIIVMVINRDGAALARYVAPLKYFFPSISKYFKMISKVLYYKFLLAVAKVSGIIIFILTVGIKENCSFAVQCLLFPNQHPRSGWLLAAASMALLVNLFPNLTQIRENVSINISLVMFCMLLAMVNTWLHLAMVRLLNAVLTVFALREQLPPSLLMPPLNRPSKDPLMPLLDPLQWWNRRKAISSKQLRIHMRMKSTSLLLKVKKKMRVTLVMIQRRGRSGARRGGGTADK